MMKMLDLYTMMANNIMEDLDMDNYMGMLK